MNTGILFPHLTVALHIVKHDHNMPIIPLDCASYAMSSCGTNFATYIALRFTLFSCSTARKIAKQITCARVHHSIIIIGMKVC